MCNYFYNKTYFTTKELETKNKIGQKIKKYVIDKSFKCDIQPIDERAYKYTWGEDIKSNIQMFCNENLLLNNILVYDTKTYKVEKKVPWDDYYIYAILESDIEVENEL